jgi:hypothetical protein
MEKNETLIATWRNTWEAEEEEEEMMKKNKFLCM